MIEIERRGKHSDEFELEFKPRVAAIKRLGGVRFEGRSQGLDARKSRGFIRGTLCHGWLGRLRVYQGPRLELGNNGLTPGESNGSASARDQHED